jgi:LytS/YehU family sensor histidine kinase
VINSSNDERPVRKGTGIGLSNVRERLRLIYGDQRATLVAGRLPGARYRVEIDMPLELA